MYIWFHTLHHINNSVTRVDKYNKYVKRYMFIQTDIESVNSQQKMSKIEHYFHSTICVVPIGVTS